MLGILGGLHLGMLVFFFSLKLYMHESELLANAGIIWCSYFSLLCLFHFFEFFITALYQSASLSYNSFIVNHSQAYTVAALASWLEFWIEAVLFGGSRWKFNFYTLFFGVLMVIGGQYTRSLAMATCGSNFDHVIMVSRKPEHKLVTHGIYAVLRHPSYFGWFYWSIGTQVEDYSCLSFGLD